MEIPMPWERLLWSGRPAIPLSFRRERYAITDLRLVAIRTGGGAELAIADIGDVQRTQSRLERLAGLSTIVVSSRDPRRAPVVLRAIRRGAEVAALLELLSGDPGAPIDHEAARAAIDWNPGGMRRGTREALAAIAAVFVAVCAVFVGFHGRVATVAYSDDDEILPGGVKKTQADIVRFMQRDVMPWARVTLGPLKGGPSRVTCETCHGAHPEDRGWAMPAVAALPQPDVRARGWETFGGSMDAQMRNAIYGYIAESDKQTKAAYMREFVMPGMARLLHRPAYDFTRSYDYNRAHGALGCYHCHMVR